MKIVFLRYLIYIIIIIIIIIDSLLALKVRVPEQGSSYT